MPTTQIYHKIPDQNNDFTIGFALPKFDELHRLINLTLVAVIEVMVLIISAGLTTNLSSSKVVSASPVVSQTRPVVLGEKTIFDESELETALLPESTPTPTTRPQPRRLEYKIAIIGDSMVDTMGERLEYLEHAMIARYPSTKFVLYNYGVGSQNVSDGLARIEQPLRYMDRTYPRLTDTRPDIIVVGSFAYNPYTPHNRDKHWLELTRMVQYAQTITSNVYILAEIAPLRQGFGKGPMGVNWSDATIYEHTGHIVEQLQNVLGLSKTLNVPLIDGFMPTVTNTDFNGTEALVNQSDHIHPSVEGHIFMADRIAETIELK